MIPPLDWKDWRRMRRRRRRGGGGEGEGVNVKESSNLRQNIIEREVPRDCSYTGLG